MVILVFNYSIASNISSPTAGLPVPPIYVIIELIADTKLVLTEVVNPKIVPS